ncbi:MAG: aspartate kinase [Clostridia bacterium]|jgi:aspartate kinase|nr:aspartate kinase [Clostridia bacterium]MBQ5791217.1 aspartate kinase [Clostridia bacterium]
MKNVYQNKVVKFGGSSLASAEQILKAVAIIRGEESRRFVVPSAPGKRFSSDTKVTDLLIKVYNESAAGLPFEETFREIAERYLGIIRGLGLDLDLTAELETIHNQLAEGTTLDYVASRGEYLNGVIMAYYLGFTFIDAAEVIFFDEDGNFEAELTNRVMSRRLSRCKNAVIPGFYGSMPNGAVKTFSRGGSDITGAIVARAAKADLYENWTDVSGFLMVDPRIVEDPKPIEVITYRELRELSYMGASVLHEDAIFPVKVAGIPINIKNTNRPDDDGTFIVPKGTARSHSGVITGIAGRKGLKLIHLEKDMMNQEIGFGLKVLQVIADMGISFEHLPSGIDTMCVVLSAADLEGREQEILSRIDAAVHPDFMSIEDKLALVAVVGRGMAGTPGTACRVFNALAREDINIRMIDQGSSELNIIVGVNEDKFEHAIRAIYAEFAE